jgi:hypothetical protein
MAKESFDEWAMVELMGHQRIAGRVTEAEIGGCKFVRVDVPESEGRQPLTKFLGPSAIYAITPMTEESARAMAVRIDADPIQIWDARRLVELDDKRKAIPAMIDKDIMGDEEEQEDYPF